MASPGCRNAINAVHTVRCGFNYANNPVPDDMLNPLFPAIPTTHLTLGYGANLGKWSVDVAYEHAFEESQYFGGIEASGSSTEDKDTASALWYPEVLSVQYPPRGDSATTTHDTTAAAPPSDGNSDSVSDEYGKDGSKVFSLV